jgi:REP element-mobilizing transposase RayT
MYLKNEKVAQIVVACLRRGVELCHYDLGAWVLMANHVHVLLWPKIGVSRLLCSLKGVTAREANKILARTGSPFWQAESYDHRVRDDTELVRIWRYIENNPVKAGIAARPEAHRWSSAGAGTSPGAAGTSACATV